ncbi:PAS domain S-box protein [Halorubrum sp. JWXQ-INN 858]|uniref:PAS domain S-box protein n=1 Tax=Halorubrum sp. JWXQ-INN 858 TaxID=2690782 RepID=UPI00135714D7|nr:PAS domain S-box protein [Halorubrum sp. JWXQ-INN 858]MWV64092.1 PAS domain S-box protein [Halorubrum sp. JWXQ-INN 858]
MEALREVLDALPDAVLVVDGAGTVRFANRHVEAVLGYDPDDLEGDSVETLLNAPDREPHAAMREAYMRDPQPRPMGTGLDLYARRADGTEIPVTISLGPVERDGETVIVATVIDVREEREREAALTRRTRTLAALHQATQELLKTTDRELGAAAAVDYVNDVLGLPIAAIWLYDDDVDALVPAAWTDAAVDVVGDHPTFEAGTGSIAWDVFEAGDPRYVADTHGDPDRYNPETPIRSELHVPLGRYGVLTVGSTEPEGFDEADRTVARLWGATVTMVFVRIERERQLRAREAEVKHERDRLEEFASLVSHDLRNPLNVAAGNLDLAREAHDSDELRTVANALDRMAALVDDMLTLARQGDEVDELESVPLTDLAAECWASVDTRAATLSMATDMTVRADRSRLAQVFENLFRNAVEHGEEDARVTVGALPDGDGFYVADDGPGVDPSRREDLFEAGVTTAPDGTGFGLKIVSEIARAHGWSVSLADDSHPEPDGEQHEKGGEGRERDGDGARFEFRGVSIVAD